MIKKKEALISIIIAVLLVTTIFAVTRTIYQINPSRCNACGNCVSHCDQHAIVYNSSTHKYKINADLCEGCGDCEPYCPRNAIYETTVPNEDIVQPNSSIKLNIYPNPVKDNASIEYALPKSQNQGMVRIFNLKGEVVDQYSINKADGKISWSKKNNASGTYFAQIISGKERICKKIIVIK